MSFLVAQPVAVNSARMMPKRLVAVVILACLALATLGALASLLG
ncbi:hypothetical protein [Kibdelosporangium phytohabitans]|nr:hypothetical protein [Kibdelosporangium phytohabitans]MBE1466731.1 hypothetical protein [Kibdelosporangium phytohabitans]